MTPMDQRRYPPIEEIPRFDPKEIGIVPWQGDEPLPPHWWERVATWWRERREDERGERANEDA
jgi:hypothetical protein